MPLEMRIDQLMARLAGVEALGFEELFDDVAQRADLIVTFLAILEMIRLKVLRVFQSGAGGPIRVYRGIVPRTRPDRSSTTSTAARPQGTPGSQS